MTPPQSKKTPGPANASTDVCSNAVDASPARPSCPVCGGKLFEVKAKLQCSRCRTICETCCEGGQG